ncbi:amidohydrolase family protein [Streptomyces sp. SID10853]|uniref:amidohydrolase family protein n=1 Tax=Streptomyces sp. SID10853 TaxID=2706028 RepID=UPI0013BF8322|nr:amidohydrolase family protein [Streptomyces sp. SID10853]NDZ79302.1 amidohydrolase family protein [Streptomyces sp. SID10853]
MATTTAIDDVRVFTGDGLTPPRRVYIEGEEFTVDGIPDVVVDGAGKFLLPGLIDSHMHTLGRDDLANLAQSGVTTGLDMAAWPLPFVTEMRAQAGVAQIRSATTPAVGPGGNHAKMPGFPADAIVTSPQEAYAFVERRVADGADYIKIVTEAAPPEGMDQATVNTIVEAAHEHDLLVVAHSITTGAFRIAVEAGVDVSTHAPLDAVLDDETVARMRDAGMSSSPTLTMMKGIAGVRTAAGLRYEYARDTVTKFHEAGIRLLVGTDANSAPGVPFAPRHGMSFHDELELMVEAGLTPVEALRGATTLTARTFGLDDRGAIEPGRRADLVLVGADPTADITATRTIEGVWIAGERVR